MLRGITIQLLNRIQTGEDEFKRPVYENIAENIHNVLVAPLSDTEVLDTLNLTGRKAIYQLAIPKGDRHEWENKHVRFFGETWRVIGKPVRGVDELIPLGWNLKVKVESVNVGESQN